MTTAIKICLWVLAFIPLVSDNTVFSPANSNFFMRSFIIIASVLFLIQFFYSKLFREGMVEKTKKLFRHPIIISILAFLLISIISTVFAVDKYSAFWGTVERAEGLMGLIYFFSFFVFSFFLFEKKDWLWFFKLSLFASFAILVKEFWEFLNHTPINSFFSNSTFLSGYLLFSMACAFVVFGETKNKFFKYLSVFVAIFSVLGIFVAQTRSAIVGLIAGFLFLLVYGIFKGKNISYKNLNFRTVSIIILSIIIVFFAIFIPTRKSEVWQNVPGLSRVALIGGQDSTTQTRILMGELSLKAVNPTENGLKKLLIGWGPENFSIAYDKYFDARQFDFEVGWFDRAHNKLLDLLVMTGILGLISYLSIYFFLFYYVWKTKENPLWRVGIALFMVASGVNLLFIFDQITTYIPFFAILAFVLYFDLIYGNQKEIGYEQRQDGGRDISVYYFASFFVVLVAFLGFAYFKNDLPAYLQMREYNSLKSKNDAQVMLENINDVFEPFTTAQMVIRRDLLSLVSSSYKNDSDSIVKLSEISFERAEEYARMMSGDIQFLNFLAFSYVVVGNSSDNAQFIQNGQDYFKQLISISPKRPDFNYGLALSYLYQDKYTDSLNIFESIFGRYPKYFDQEGNGPEAIYVSFIKHFYQVKDKDNFFRVAKRLKENKYVDSATLDNIILFIQKNNIWPNINFNK